jgi:septum site-determining protein MinD
MVQLNKMMGVEDVLELLAIPLIGIVPDDERIIVATNKGEPLVLSGEVSPPATAYTNIARRLEGEKVPLLDLMAVNDSLLGRIRRMFGG